MHPQINLEVHYLPSVQKNFFRGFHFYDFTRLMNPGVFNSRSSK